MHPRLVLRLLRRENRQPALPLANPTTGEVDVACKDLGERLTDAIAAADCDPAEAERLRLAYLKERG